MTALILTDAEQDPDSHNRLGLATLRRLNSLLVYAVDPNAYQKLYKELATDLTNAH